MEGDSCPCNSLASFARIKARVFAGKSSNFVMTGALSPSAVATSIHRSADFAVDRFVFGKLRKLPASRSSTKTALAGCPPAKAAIEKGLGARRAAG
jgi:hypothetical protein